MIKAGIDLGAGSIRIVTEEDGVVFDEASMIAIDEKGNCLAYGNEALEMKGVADPQVRVLSPMQDGRLDFELLGKLLDQLFYQLKLFRMFQKTVFVLSYPSGLQPQDVEQLKDQLLQMGAWKVYSDQEIWVSAIGARLDVSLPVYSCVLNMGERSCDIAVFSRGRIRKQDKSADAGIQVKRAIRQWLRDNRQLAVSEMTLEKICRNIGCAVPRPHPRQMEITGISTVNRAARREILTENDVAGALGPLCGQWALWIARFLQTLDRDAQQDVRMRGIVSCGGTMKLAGLSGYLQSVLNCPVYVTENPTMTVTDGLSILLSRME